MTYDNPESDDPSMLVGVVLPGDLESTRAMAESFADEFAALGHGEERILDLFRQPFYAGPHQALAVLGEDTIRSMVQESVEFWRHRRVAVRDALPSLSPCEDALHSPLVQIQEVPCRK